MNAMHNRYHAPRRRPQLAGREHAGAGLQQRQNGMPGNAQRNYDRYLALAREAALMGDAVETENWYQHAEHYFRMLRGRT